MRILALSYANAQDYKEKILYSKIPIISIINFDQLPLFPEREHTLTVQFDDISPKIKFWEKQFICMNENQALKIIQHIKKYDKSKLFLIHCSAGICRSGAIANFIHILLNTDKEQFKEDNPNIMPNKWVEDLLFYTYNVYKDSGIF